MWQWKGREGSRFANNKQLCGRGDKISSEYLCYFFNPIPSSYTSFLIISTGAFDLGQAVCRKKKVERALGSLLYLWIWVFYNILSAKFFAGLAIGAPSPPTPFHPTLASCPSASPDSVSFLNELVFLLSIKHCSTRWVIERRRCFHYNRCCWAYNSFEARTDKLAETKRRSIDNATRGDARRRDATRRHQNHWRSDFWYKWRVYKSRLTRAHTHDFFSIMSICLASCWHLSMIIAVYTLNETRW